MNANLINPPPLYRSLERTQKLLFFDEVSNKASNGFQFGSLHDRKFVQTYFEEVVWATEKRNLSIFYATSIPTITQTAISRYVQFSRIAIFEGLPTDKSSEI